MVGRVIERMNNLNEARAQVAAKPLPYTSPPPSPTVALRIIADTARAAANVKGVEPATMLVFMEIARFAEWCHK